MSQRRLCLSPTAQCSKIKKLIQVYRLVLIYEPSSILLWLHSGPKEIQMVSLNELMKPTPVDIFHCMKCLVTINSKILNEVRIICDSMCTNT